jgi:predicted RNA-binding Zn-ribbon protein involved in translation (DUF1610 family)
VSRPLLLLGVKSILERIDVIDRYYDAKLGWFAAGANSFLLFKEAYEQRTIAFECAIVHGSEAYRIVPDTGLYGFKCPSCGTQIDADVADSINAFYDAEQSMPKRDMRLIRIRCSNCRREGTLDNIPCDQETQRYIACTARLPKPDMRPSRH